MSIKEQIHRLVDSLPEEREGFVEELQYRLYVLEKVEKGLRELDEGRGVEEDDARRELAKWLTD